MRPLRLTIYKKVFALTLILCCALLSQAQQSIIKNGDTWHYYDNGYLNSDWYVEAINTNWKSGPTPIGYGDRKVVTNINYGSDAENKEVAKYFKKDIYINDEGFIAYEFKIQYDDGFVLYVNDKELYRGNMPNGGITGKTYAITTIQGREESEFKIKIFESDILKKGKNTISVSIHQNRPSSSDCIFSLDLIGHTNPKILALLLEDEKESNKVLEHEIKKMNARFEIDKITIQNENLISANYSLKFILFIVSFLLILSLTGYYYFLKSLRSKDARSVEELSKIKSHLMEKEKEMLITSTNLLHNKQYFKEIKADIRGVKTDDRSSVKSIINQIDQVLDRDDEWNHLKEHFNTVFDGFYDRLLQKHPSLTETELRHCMFIKLHMQTKEISRILLIDPRSVQTARYRIKKKMDLNEDQDLREYLLHI